MECNTIQEKLKKEFPEPTFWEKALLKIKEPLWRPSLVNVAKLFIIIFSVWFIFRIQYFYFFTDKIIPFIYKYHIIKKIFSFLIRVNYFFDLSRSIQIFIGVGSVLLALIFLIIGSFLDKEEPEKIMVLLKKSNIFPLITSYIIILIFFFPRSDTFFNFVIILSFCVFSILSVIQVISIFLKTSYLRKETKETFINDFSKMYLEMAECELKKVKGLNILEKCFESFELISITPSGPFEKNKYYEITSDKEGVLYNFDFKKIEQVEQFLKDNVKKPEIPLIEYTYFYFYENLKKGEPIAWIRKDALESEKLKKVVRMVKNSIIIKKLERPQEKAEMEFSRIRKNIILSSTREYRDKYQLKFYLDIYVKVIDSFINYLENLHFNDFIKNTKLTYNLEAINFIKKDIKDILESIIRTNDVEFIMEITYTPIIFLNRAIEKNNIFIFKEFLPFTSYLYYLAMKNKSETTKETIRFLTDRSWRYLKEFSDIYLEGYFKRGEISEENFKTYSLYIFREFQNLIKIAIDNERYIDFLNFVNKTKELFSLWLYRHGFRKKDILSYINKKRRKMFFGIGTWALHLIKTTPDIEIRKNYEDYFKKMLSSTLYKDEEYRDYNEDISLNELTKIFLEAIKEENIQFWGWVNWEFEGFNESFFTAVNTYDNLKYFYVVSALDLIERKEQEYDPKVFNLEKFAIHIDKLIEIAEEIKASKEHWVKIVLTEDKISKVDVFIKNLKKIKEEKTKKDKERIRKIFVSEEKVKEFEEEFIEKYKEKIEIKRFFEKYDLYINKMDEISIKINRIGINTLIDKTYFFDEKYLGNTVWARTYSEIFSEQILRFENYEILRELIINTRGIKEKEFIEKVTKIGKEIGKENIILIEVNSILSGYIKGQKFKVPIVPYWEFNEKEKEKWGNSGNKVFAAFKKDDLSIPIFRFYTRFINKNGILILNKNIFGKLIQYSPINSEEEKKFVKEEFLIQVIDFTKENDMNKIRKMLGNPDWLKEIGDEKAQLNYMKENVQIKILERFELKLDEDFEGYFFEIKDE